MNFELIQEASSALNVLSAMFTPAVLISAAGTLIFSTSNRLARIVDRVRELSRTIEKEFVQEPPDFIEERRAEIERQILAHSRRSRLIMRSLTSFYLALGLFVATTLCIGLVAVVNRWSWVPSVLGITGAVILFYGCVLLIAETQLALRSVNSEMTFTLHLRHLYRERDARTPKP